MKIETGKLYKSRAGYKVLIYSTDKGGGGHPVHATVQTFYDDVWMIQTYSLSGHFHSPEKESSFDIVSEWDGPALESKPKSEGLVAWLAKDPGPQASWAVRFVPIGTTISTDGRDWRRAPWLDEK